jgi:hypothetical protein
MLLHPIKIDPFLFNETIYAQRYQKLPLEPFINQLDDVEVTHSYFQQDSAIAHTVETTSHYFEVIDECGTLTKPTT